jgi:hypothetical protein
VAGGALSAYALAAAVFACSCAAETPESAQQPVAADVLTEADAAPDSTGGAEHCRNGADLGVLAGVPQDPTSSVQKAFLACLDSPQDYDCYYREMTSLLDVSPACLDCHASMVLCVDKSCRPKCIEDSDSAPCDLCVTKSGCDTAYAACSGIEPTESIVTILDGYTYCTLEARLSTAIEERQGASIQAYACTEPEDVALISREDYPTQLSLCGEACFVKGPDFAAQCVLEKIGTTVECARCLGNQVVLGNQEIPCL